MDLAAEALRLRLDLLAVELSTVLRRAGVPHALLKGPSTSLWLYEPPRPYRDVDLLVPLAQAAHAARVLQGAGLTTSRAGGVGEEAPHSLLLHSVDGFEVDLHVSLPTVPPSARVWAAVAPRLEQLDLGVGTVPALDVVGRCLVLALHALGDGDGQPLEDLRRARARCDAATWAGVDLLARRLDVADLLAAGLGRLEPEPPVPSRRARLYLDRAPETAIGLQRLADAPRHRLPGMVWHELLPSRGFMAHQAGDPDLTGRALARAHARRWRRLLRQVPASIRAVRGTAR